MTTSAAAAALGVSRRRVLHYINSGRLTATKDGRDWMIDPASVAAFEPQPAGYPKGKPRREKE